MQNFIIDIKENKNIFTLPYSYTYEDRKGFILIDYKGDVIFVCANYVRSVEHLFDNGSIEKDIIIDPPPPDCILPVSIGIVGNITPTINSTIIYTAVAVSGQKFTITWEIKGGTFIGTSVGNKVEVKWGSDLVGTSSIEASTTCSVNGLKINNKKTFILGNGEIIPPIPDELVFGTWSVVPGSVLLFKKVDSQRFFLQTNADRSFYLERGLNFLAARGNEITYTLGGFLLSNYTATLDSEAVTAEQGFKPSIDASRKTSLKWNSKWWTDKGWVLNDVGEWVTQNVVNSIVRESFTGILNKDLVITTAYDTVDIIVLPKNATVLFSNKQLTVKSSQIGLDEFQYKITKPDKNTITHVISLETKKEDVVVVPPSDKKQLVLVHFWGNGGTTQKYSGQSGARSEAYMISSNRQLLPFYGKEIPEEIVNVPRYVARKQVGFQDVKSNVEYLVTEEVIQSTISYIQRANLGGFNFLFYEDEALFSIWRKAYAASPNKRGTKMTYCLHSLGGNADEYNPSVNNPYTQSINTIIKDIKQDYYAKTRAGHPIISYKSIENFDITGNTQRVKDVKATMDLINRLYGNKIYWILNVDFYEAGQWYKENGFDAITNYYLYGNYENRNFKEAVDISRNFNYRNKDKSISVAPIITLGLDQRVRDAYYDSENTRYYTYESVKEHLPQLISETYKFLAETPDSEIGFVNHGDENTEQGEGTFLPRRTANFVIDDSIVEIFAKIK